MKHILLISLFLLPATLPLAAQTQNVDSLVKVLETGKLSDKDEMDIYYKLYQIYVDNNSEKSIMYSAKGLKLAEKEKNKLMISKFNQSIGVSYLWKASYDTALLYHNTALEYAIKANDKEQEADVYMSIGTTYLYKGELPTSLEYYMKSLAAFESIGDKSGSLSILNNIATIHIKMNNLSRATYYLRKAETMADELNSNLDKCKIYYNLGQVYLKQSEIDSTKKYVQKAYDISDTLDNIRYKSATTEFLALVYARTKDYENALKYSKEGLKLSEEFGNPREVAASWAGLANVYRYLEMWKECRDAETKALTLDSTVYKTMTNLFFNLTLANIHLGNKEQALKYLDQHQTYQEKLANEDQQKSFADMEAKYETQKKEIRIAALEKERRLYAWLGAAGALMVISMGIALWQTLRNARKERQLIAARSVQDGELNERARLAEDLHDRLGGSLSAVKLELQNAENLQKVGDKLDVCIKEVREITHNLMPRSLRLFGMKGALEDFIAQFPNVRFHFFGEEKRVKERLEFAVYCCASELITNSLRHSGAENVNVQLVQGDKYVSLTVQDDGHGFDEATVKKGIGLKNIQDRVASYNGKLDIASSPGKGTEAVIELRVEN